MTTNAPVSQPSVVEAPERITAGPCGQCGAMVAGLNACPYCGCEWIGTRVEYARVDPPSSITEKAQRAADRIINRLPTEIAMDFNRQALIAIIAAEFGSCEDNR